MVDAVRSESLRIWGYYWFLMLGFFLILYGLLCHWIENRLGRPLPSFAGWGLLAVAGFGIVLDVDTGFWLVLLVAINIIVASRRARKGTHNGVDELVLDQMGCVCRAQDPCLSGVGALELFSRRCAVGVLREVCCRREPRLGEDHAPVSKKFKCPMLLLLGELDPTIPSHLKKTTVRRRFHDGGFCATLCSILVMQNIS